MQITIFCLLKNASWLDISKAYTQIRVDCPLMVILDPNSPPFASQVRLVMNWFVPILIYKILGDSQHQVHMEGYQVSNQCQALVKDGCLVPTKDAPELGYVRQSTADLYVPDVYYKVRSRIVLPFFLKLSLS